MASRLAITLFSGVLLAATAGGVTNYVPAWIEHGVTSRIADDQQRSRDALLATGAAPDAIEAEMRAIDTRIRAESMSGSWHASRRAVVTASAMGFFGGVAFASLATFIWRVIDDAGKPGAAKPKRPVQRPRA